MPTPVPTPLPAPLLHPDWPAPATVRACFTLRGASAADGASAPPWQHFNLGAHVGDAPAAVQTNRQRLAQAIGAQPVFLQQVHGTTTTVLEGPADLPDLPDTHVADAAFTTRPGLACTVLVADCLPVLITDTQGRAVAAAHAGWRGLAAGVLESATAPFQTQLGIAPSQLMAWLGPCIGPSAFEVGPEVRAAFCARHPAAATCFTPTADHTQSGKYLANLPALARQRLAALGLAHISGHNGSPQWCTVSQPGRYFSYRREQPPHGATGRMAACIWRVQEV